MKPPAVVLYGGNTAGGTNRTIISILCRKHNVKKKDRKSRKNGADSTQDAQVLDGLVINSNK